MAVNLIPTQLHSELKLFLDESRKTSRLEVVAKFRNFVQMSNTTGKNFARKFAIDFLKNVIKVAGNFEEHVKRSSALNKGIGETMNCFHVLFSSTFVKTLNGQQMLVNLQADFVRFPISHVF